ncbi:MAG: hypothetical protein IJK97_16090 [Thermoguttaceae bacterium]|nr:hypothetical protein [Thermoguttaceae bacterium]MBR0190965.1 hypothetical protein [Thermoguttaceae bacterium]
MTIGLILCLIVVLTVAGVLWNYQYMTIQSVEMECAARSAIQAAINDLNPDTSIEKVLQTPQAGEVTGTTLNQVLNATYNHQNSGNRLTVTLVDSTNRILKFEQKHKLGIFSGTLKQQTRSAIENKSFIQYYQINGSEGNYTFNKCSI